MMKLSTKIATGLAILGLVGPALAATPSTASPAAKTATVHKHRHHKVAQTETRKDEGKGEHKADPKAGAKKEKAEKMTTSAPSAGAAPTAPPAK